MLIIFNFSLVCIIFLYYFVFDILYRVNAIFSISLIIHASNFLFHIFIILLLIDTKLIIHWKIYSIRYLLCNNGFVFVGNNRWGRSKVEKLKDWIWRIGAWSCDRSFNRENAVQSRRKTRCRTSLGPWAE